MEEMPSLNMPVQRLKVANLPLDFLLWARNPFRGNFNHWQVSGNYSATGRRNHVRPLKRLLDTWEWNGLTSGPTPWKIYDDDDDILHFPYIISLLILTKWIHLLGSKWTLLFYIIFLWHVSAQNEPSQERKKLRDHTWYVSVHSTGSNLYTSFHIKDSGIL